MGEIVTTREEGSELTVTGGERDSMSIATVRAAEEVKAAMVIAKKFPRDEASSLARILRACKRPGLAEQSQYEYQRGGTPIKGISIRLAEALAQAWGNLDFGVTELAQDSHSSVVQAHCIDLETNTRQTKTFTVPHERHTKKGKYRLTDPRDIYEMVANQGARRVRACILGIIPGDVADKAVAECNKTLEGDGSVSLADRIRNVMVRFAEYGVTREDLERKLQHKMEACTLTELAALGRRFKAIQDGFSTAAAEFPPEDKGQAQREDIRKKMANGQKVASESAPKRRGRPRKSEAKAKPPADEKPTPPPEPEPPADDIDPETGEVLSDEPPADEEPTPQPPTQQQQASTSASQMSPREQLIAQYKELCESRGQRPYATSQMSDAALKGHISLLKEKPPV